MRSAGIVAYGLIPTQRRLEGLEPPAIFTRWLTMAALVGDPQEMARHAMITATCGLSDYFGSSRASRKTPLR